MNDKKSAVKSKVALVSCDTYDEERVYEAIGEGLDLIGGISQFISSGEKIVVKPNVLFGASPESCVCTHPSVLKAAGRLLLEAGASVTCGDSSGFGSCSVNMKRAGLMQAAEEIGIGLADFDRGKIANLDKALINDRFVIANGILEADGLVSLSKLKTHEFTVFTGAIKNQFGCIPGTLKSQFHIRFPEPQDFSAMLVDLTTLIKPRFYIMDAVMAMEGNGPRSGNPRKLGLLLFSSDPVALDAVACRIIKLEPEIVPTSGAGEKAGLGKYHDDAIDVVGEKIEDFTCDDFQVVRKRQTTVSGEKPSRRIRKQLSIFMRKYISQRPSIDKLKCTSCGICVKYCPVTPKAVDWSRAGESKPPVHNYGICIRCFCCQEFCPEGAISVQEPWLGRILSRMYGMVFR